MGEPNPTPGLELVTSLELVEELCRRFECLVVLASEDMDAQRYQILRRVHGNQIMVTGLVARMWMEQQQGSQPCTWESFGPPADDVDEESTDG